jgi:hypothetical protein
MKIVIAAALGVALSACNQTTQTAETTLPPPSTAALASSPARALPAEEDTVAPLYEPLVDTNRVNLAKLKKDLLECRAQAAPQEAAARRAAQQQATGAAIQVAGTLASYIPVPGFRQAHMLAGAANAVQSVGANTAGNAAETGARALEDYVLVVNACMEHRKYRLLRA